MLNRRILRIKVMQALYAYFQSAEPDMVQFEKQLMLSIDRVYQLYLHYLILPVELADMAEVQMAEARNKVLPTEEDINPNRRFVESYLIQALREHPQLKKKISDQKVSWSKDRDSIKKLWKEIRQSDVYREFLNAEDIKSEHRRFLEKLFDRFILGNDDIYSAFQERSIYWDFDDHDYAILMAMRYFSKIKSEDSFKPIPDLLKDKEEDLYFIKHLFRKTITNDKENSKLIEAKTKNWEVDRIALLDVLLMKMAITELTHFSSIPEKVTLNEYIEMAKLFSTAKSKMFINGVLDKLLIELKEKKMIKKTGRGLMQ
jgi:N utilization substance protein B